jgi:polysaccharide deacetylase 2 family uncharacterized protein YibQ
MGKRKKRGRHVRVARKWGVAVFVLAFLGFLGIGFLCIKDSRSFDTFRKGAEHARSLLSTRLKDSFPISSPTPLNEGEKGFIWAKEFDLAIREDLPKMGLDSAILSGGCGSEEKSSSPKRFNRVVEFRENIPWVKIRQITLDLVRDQGGKVFQGHEKTSTGKTRQITFYLGAKEALTWSYILVFQRKPSLEAPSPETSTSETSIPETPMPETSMPETSTTELPPAARRRHKPMIALVIDDVGYNRSLAESLFSLNMVLTVSILPHHPFSRESAQEAHRKSCEVILHLPMEPQKCASTYWEKDTLLVHMSEQKILQVLDSGLRDVPWAEGVNNHMGSLMLQDKRSMQVILDELKSRGLYFLDSRTTSRSVGYELAQAMGVPSACRQIFLDNKQDLNYIQHQIDLLIKKALKDGKAVGIGHLHPLTIEALKEAAPRFREKGITLVGLSRVVE